VSKKRRSKRRKKPTPRIVITPRVKARFQDREIELLINRALEKHDGSPLWISQYRTLYGHVRVIIEDSRKGLVCYDDELPTEFREKFSPTWKIEDEAWGEYVKAVWRATDGRVGGFRFTGD